MNGHLSSAPALSVVIPVYDEEPNILPLYHRLRSALAATGRTYELIYIDDASRDHTVDALRALQRQDPCVRTIVFRRNCGQTAAMCAGIQAARGEAVVTMDGDLQNDPRDIPTMLGKLDHGYDVVIGWRRARQDPLLSRTLPSKIANWLIGKITGVAVHDSGCSLKAYRSEIIKAVPLYSEMHRFIPALAASTGASLTEVVVQHHPRRYGKSKYGLSRIAKVLLDVITVKMLINCAERPMHWFAGLSLPFWGLTSLTMLASIWSWGEHNGIVLPLLMLLFAYLASYLVFVGLLSELIIRAKGSSHAGRIANGRQFGRTSRFQRLSCQR